MILKTSYHSTRHRHWYTVRAPTGSSRIKSSASTWAVMRICQDRGEHENKKLSSGDLLDASTKDPVNDYRRWRIRCSRPRWNDQLLKALLVRPPLSNRRVGWSETIPWNFIEINNMANKHGWSIILIVCLKSLFPSLSLFNENVRYRKATSWLLSGPAKWKERCIL